MLVLVAIVGVGFLAGRLGYMGGDFDKKLSGLIIDFTCPALILSSTMGEQLPQRDMVAPLLLISTITYIVLTGIALTLPRLLTHRRSDEGIVGFALMFGNVGFIGYPIAASIFGHEAVFYAAVLNVVNTFAVFTVGTMLISGNGNGNGNGNENGNGNGNGNENGNGDGNVYGNDAGNGKRIRSGFRLRSGFHYKILYSPPMVAAYLAILIVSLGLDNIPRVVSQPLTMIGAITVPGALLIIGSSMSRLPLRTMLGNTTVYATTACRLVVIPMALYFLCHALGFSPFVVSLNTVIIAMPVATYGTILCLRNGRDTTLITELTFITTLLSVVTIPLLALIFNA